MAEVDGGAHDGGAVPIGRHVDHERLVDLDLPHREPLQVGQRGVAGPEVVDRDLDAGRLQPLQRVLGFAGDDGALGDLEAELLRRHLPGPEQLLHRVGQLAVEQVARREVDRDADLDAGLRPGVNLAERLVEDPRRQRLDQVGLLRRGDEVVRRQQSVNRMPPANQRLDLQGLAVDGADDRLIVKHELELVDRVAELADQGHALAVLAPFLIDGVDAEAAACPLGGVHGDVGAADQGRRIVGMLREGGDPDAHGGRDRLAVDDERLIHRIEDFFRDQDRARHVGRAPGHNGKLIAAITGHRVRLAQHAAHPFRHLQEEPVAGLMAQAVVDAFEPVQVHQEDGTWFHLTLTGTDRLLETLLKEGSIGKAGQRIVQRLVLQRFRFRLALGDVAQAANHQALRPEPAHVEFHGKGRAIFAQARSLVAAHLEEMLLGP